MEEEMKDFNFGWKVNIDEEAQEVSIEKYSEDFAPNITPFWELLVGILKNFKRPSRDLLQ